MKGKAKTNSAEPLFNKELIAAVRLLYSEGVIDEDRDIAEAVKLSKGTISQYLNGKVKASKPFIEKFEKVYKLSLDDFKTNASGQNILPGKHNITLQDYIDEKESRRIESEKNLHFLQRIVEKGILDIKTNLEEALQDLDAIETWQHREHKVMMKALDQLTGNQPGSLAAEAGSVSTSYEQINFGKNMSSGKSK